MATPGQTNWKFHLFLFTFGESKNKISFSFWNVSLTVFITFSILWGASYLHPILYWILWIYLAYTCLATRSLAFEALKVYKAIQSGSIEKARYQVGMIVGRETDHLSIPEICNATIETVAENASDGVIGPLLCLFIGGPVFAMGYKAINTLDSMVGYKTAKYRKIGFVSAKIDDFVNLIPARLTWLFMMASARILQLDFRNAIKIGWRDRYQHASPNSAFPESVVAGALGIQLGGAHIYHGELITKPTIGDPTRSVEPDDILSSISILYMTTTVSVFVLSIIYFIVAIY